LLLPGFLSNAAKAPLLSSHTVRADVSVFAAIAFATRITHRTKAATSAARLRRTTKPVVKTNAHGATTIKIHDFSGTTALQ
jgi:hypothetical protein